MFANSVTARIFGKSKDEVIGRRDDELLPPEISGAVQHLDETIMSAGEARTSEEHILEHGKGVRTYLSTKAPWRDQKGNIIGLIGIARDITERKHREQALRDSEATVRALLENASQGIVAVNAEGRIDQVNGMAETIFGYTRQEAIGQSIEVLLPERFRHGLDLPPFLTHEVKTQNPSKGELSHGVVT